MGADAATAVVGPGDHSNQPEIVGPGETARPSRTTAFSTCAVAVEELHIGYSPRRVLLDEEHVATLLEVLDELPPIVVNAKTMTLIDGVHRLEAFRRAGRIQIDAVMFTGNDLEALVIAIRSNVQHGKPLSPRERKAAASALLQRCPEQSDRWIGATCGISHSTVAALRVSSADAVDVRVRVGRDGRRRPVHHGAGCDTLAKALKTGPYDSPLSITANADPMPSSVARRTVTTRSPLQQASQDASQAAIRHNAPTVTDPAQRAWVNDSAFKSQPHLTALALWLDKTAVADTDFTSQLDATPLGRLYDIVEECRRRARIWERFAIELEKKARSAHPQLAP